MQNRFARVRVIGRGRAGRGLASAWRRAGLDVSLVSGRTKRFDALDPSTVIVVAVPDPALPRVDAILADAVRKNVVVLHCAASHGVDALPECAARGALVGVMHPLVSFADPKRPPSLAGTTFVVAGPKGAIAAASQLGEAAGAHIVKRDVHSPRYHAAAALAANGATALAAEAVRVLCALGLAQREAERAIGGLLRSVGENVERVGLPKALTGPIVRGDHAAVAAHRAALDARSRALYDAIAPSIVALAIDAGLEPERARAIRGALRKRTQRR